MLKRSRCFSASVPTLPRYCRVRASKIAFSAVELDHLLNGKTVLDLCSLTARPGQPDDRLAWLATLRARGGGLRCDLFVVAEACGKRR